MTSGLERPDMDTGRRESLSAAPPVGNDVVDLGEARCAGKSRDTRFVERVFSASEQAGILSDADPDRALWRRWAAKEASYKVVTKLHGAAPTFAHAAFEVDFDDSGVSGLVRYGELVVPFGLHEAEDHLHAIAFGGANERAEARIIAGLEEKSSTWAGSAPTLADLRERFFQPAEREFVYSLPSALVRMAARRDMASALDVAEEDILILAREGQPGRVPPVVLVGGAAGRVDLSLSHDGRYVAWVFTVR